MGEGRLAEGHPLLFDGIGAYSGWGFTITGGDRAESVDGARVTPELLQVLGVQPLHGRLLHAGEGAPGRDRVTILGESLWRRRFGADPSAVGRTIEIDGIGHEIIGVLPASFAFPDGASAMWLPIPIDAADPGYGSSFAVRIARLAPGVDARAADAELAAEAERLQRERPTASGGRLVERARVVPLRDHFVRDAKTPLLLLLGAVALLLLLACANVANLMLTRATTRRAEMALRSALGADRGRLVRQMLIESLVLAAAGAAAGIAIAYLLVRIIAPLAPEDIPNLEHAAVNGRALAIAALTALVSAVVFGVLPAARATRVDLRALLGSRGAGRANAGAQLRSVFAFAQITIAVLLAVSAALLGRSFVNLTRVDLGFDATRVLTLRASAPSFTYTEDSQVRELFGKILEQTTTVPGVESAGVIQLLPLTGGNWNPDVRIEGVPAGVQYPSDINWRTVSPGYFAAMRIPLRAGRLLTPADDHQGMPVAVVNETFARVVFRGADPIGRRIRTGFEPAGVWATVVGIVGDVRQHAVATVSNPEIYRPFSQHPIPTMRMMVRTATDPLDAAGAIRARIAALDTNIAVGDLEPMTAVVDRALGGTKLPLLLAASLSIVALTIGIIGVAGVIGFDVAERRSEIGIRLALGGTPAGIKAGFLRRASKLGLAGLAAGLVASTAAATTLESLLYGVSAGDPLTAAVVSGVCMGAILLAAYLPARRAARVDPMVTLRGD